MGQRGKHTIRNGREGCEPARPVRDTGAIPIAAAAQASIDQGGVGLTIEWVRMRSISDLLIFGLDALPDNPRGSASVVNEWETAWGRPIRLAITY